MGFNKALSTRPTAFLQCVDTLGLVIDVSSLLVNGVKTVG